MESPSGVADLVTEPPSPPSATEEAAAAEEAEAAKVQMYALQEVLKEVQAGPAISLACLLEFSDCTQDKFREIMERIIGAFDAGVVGPGARIGFELYVEIKCFL